MSEQWRQTQLGKVCEIILGQSPSSDTYNQERTGLPFFQGKSEFGSKYAQAKTWCSDPLKVANKEDILISVRAPVGESNLAPENCCIGRGLAALRADQENLLQEFLWHQIDFKKGYLQGISQGSTFDAISGKDLSELEVEVPPLPEQKKIAEILSGIDRSNQVEVNMASKIAKQYQGVLSQIFDDASKQIPLGDYLPLGDLGLDISDGNYSAKYPSASEFVERGVPFIRASNMKEGTIDDKDMRFISATKHQEITKGHLKSGDILIANRGEIGKASRVPERHIGSNINAQVVRINGGKRIESSFLFHYLSSPFCQILIDELTTGTALKQLPIGNLVKLMIPAPEMSVQISTGGALDSMQRVMNAINEKIRKRSQLKQALATELLSGRKRVSV